MLRSSYDWPHFARDLISRSTNPEELRYQISLDGPFSWLFLLDLRPDQSVVDLGPGYGGLAEKLVPHVSQYYAVDTDRFRLHVTQKRISIFSPGSVIYSVATTQNTYLPFPSDSVDLVIMQDWPSSFLFENHAPIISTSSLNQNITSGYPQRYYPVTRLLKQLLKEIYRILKPDGQFFFVARNLLDHESIFNTNRLTRLPAAFGYAWSFASFLATYINQPYSRALHTYAGYRGLLEAAGFNASKFFELVRNREFLETIYPLDKNIGFFKPPIQSSIKKKLKRSKYFAPLFGIRSGIEKKLSPSLIHCIIGEVETRLREELEIISLVIDDWILSRKDKSILLCSGNGNKLVIRLPLNENAHNCEIRNAEMLSFLKATFPDETYYPLFLLHDSLNGFDFFVERFVPGIPISAWLNNTEPPFFYRLVSGLLKRINPNPLQAENAHLTDQTYKHHVVQRLNSLFRVIGDRNKQNKISQYFEDRLYGAEIPTGISHGDFSMSNILVNNGIVRGVIDWEGGNKNGLPILDAINFVDSFKRLLTGGIKPGESIPRLTSLHSLPPAERDFLIQQYERWQIPPSYHEALVYLKWLQHVSYLLDFWLIYHDEALDAYVYQVIDTMNL